MEDLSILLEEHAQPRTLVRRELSQRVVVVDRTAGLLTVAGRHLVVVIKIRSIRRHPLELPSHAPLEGIDLRQRRPRDRDECGVALRQMDCRPVKRVCQERTARTSLFPSRTEHEVIHNQLAPPVEKIGQRFFPIHGLEYILLLDFFPGHFAALPAQLVAQPGELFFLREQFLSRGKPLRRADHFRCKLLVDCRCVHAFYSFSLEVLFSPFFLPRTFRTNALNPPVETTPPTTTPALATHAGHIK